MFLSQDAEPHLHKYEHLGKYSFNKSLAKNLSQYWPNISYILLGYNNVSGASTFHCDLDSWLFLDICDKTEVITLWMSTT